MGLLRVVLSVFVTLSTAMNATARSLDASARRHGILSARRSVLSEKTYGSSDAPGAYPPAPPGPVTITKKEFSNDFSTLLVELNSDRASQFYLWCSPTIHTSFGTKKWNDVLISNLRPATSYDCETSGSTGEPFPSTGPKTYFSFSTPNPVPEKVEVVTQAIGKDSASFRVYSDGATSFEMTCSSPGIKKTSAKFSGVGSMPGAFVATLNGLKPGAQYTCSIVGVGYSGTPGSSRSVTFKTASQSGNLPSKVVARSLEEQQKSAILKTTLSYRAKSHEALCYGASSPYERVKTRVSTGSVVTVTAYDLRENTDYVCEIFGKNEFGSGAPLWISFKTKKTAPSPVVVKSIKTTKNSAEIVTSKSPLSVSFETSCWSDSPGKTVPPVVVRRIGTSSAMYFRLTNLVPKTKYACKLVPIGKGGVRGGYTATGVFETK